MIIMSKKMSDKLFMHMAHSDRDRRMYVHTHAHSLWLNNYEETLEHKLGTDQWVITVWPSHTHTWITGPASQQFSHHKDGSLRIVILETTMLWPPQAFVLSALSSTPTARLTVPAAAIHYLPQRCSVRHLEINIFSPYSWWVISLSERAHQSEQIGSSSSFVITYFWVQSLV